MKLGGIQWWQNRKNVRSIRGRTESKRGSIGEALKYWKRKRKNGKRMSTERRGNSQTTHERNRSSWIQWWQFQLRIRLISFCFLSSTFDIRTLLKVLTWDLPVLVPWIGSAKLVLNILGVILSLWDGFTLLTPTYNESEFQKQLAFPTGKK